MCRFVRGVDGMDMIMPSKVAKTVQTTADFGGFRKLMMRFRVAFGMAVELLMSLKNHVFLQRNRANSAA